MSQWCVYASAALWQARWVACTCKIIHEGGRPHLSYTHLYTHIHVCTITNLDSATVELRWLGLLNTRVEHAQPLEGRTLWAVHFDFLCADSPLVFGPGCCCCYLHFPSSESVLNGDRNTFLAGGIFIVIFQWSQSLKPHLQWRRPVLVLW